MFSLGALSLGVFLLIAVSTKWCFRADMAMKLISLATLFGFTTFFAGQAINVNDWLLAFIVFGTQMVAFIGEIAFLFYRDPERTPPGDKDALISPADGEVIYIRKIEPGAAIHSTKHGCNLELNELSGTALDGKALWQIGISMKFTDVHVNRSPISGVVKKLVHTPGKFLSLRLDVATRENERQTILIASDRATVGVVQIASRLVRQIAAYVKEAESLALAQRIGIIKFGSQVDVLVPVDDLREVIVKEGESIRAGLTIIARLAR
jgi:phosphatidylserine decarboxylase